MTLRCFDIPRMSIRDDYLDWIDLYKENPTQLPDNIQAAMARLIPSLLCGEQSAVLAFEREHERTSKDLLHTIAVEENSHELALQEVMLALPAPDDLEDLRLRAKGFFLGLGQSPTPALHFAKISQLDSFVCKILREVEKSKLAADPLLRHLVRAIKLDEAMHVHASRRHATELGIKPHDQYNQTHNIVDKFIEFITPLGDAFEVIGVDLDAITQRRLYA